jgi:hypothetical protein
VIVLTSVAVVSLRRSRLHDVAPSAEDAWNGRVVAEPDDAQPAAGSITLSIDRRMMAAFYLGPACPIINLI